MSTLTSLPFIIQAPDGADYHALIHYLQESNQSFKQLLLEHGAILFKGYNVSSIKQFAEVVEGSGLGDIFHYDNCAVPRVKLKSGIYTSIVPSYLGRVELHNEKSYSETFPDYIIFNCIQPALSGGSTPIIDGHLLWHKLPESIKGKLEREGIIIQSGYYRDGWLERLLAKLGFDFSIRNWQKVFNVETKKQLEQLLTKQNIKFYWRYFRRKLIIEYKLPAYRIHPQKNIMVWFNQISHNNRYFNAYHNSLTQRLRGRLLKMLARHDFFFTSFMTYGNYQEMTQQEAKQVNELIKKLQVNVSWQKGDVMFVDNYSCLHGKEPHQGKRFVLTAMTKN